MGLRSVLAKGLSRNIVIAAAIALVALVGFRFANNRTVTVSVAGIEKNVPIRVFGLGTVEARVVSKIGFEVGAAIAELKVDHGDRVKKGDILAVLASSDQRAKVAKAKAGVLSAEVSLKKAEANVEKAAAVLAQRQEANKRKQALVGRNVVSEQSAEEAQRDEFVAKAELTVAQADTEVARAAIANARADFDFESTMLAHRTLIAPFDGTVIERHKELGTVIKSGDPIFTLVEANSNWGLAYVDEQRAGFIVEGQRVEARLRSRPQDHFIGKVIRIGLESDRASEERRVYVKGDNPPSDVFLGEQAEFWITVAELQSALLVPEAAVHGYDGRQGTVWTLENGQLQRRLLAFRHRTEDARLEIVSGLPDKAQVVTEGVTGLKEGRAARAAAAVVAQK